MTTINLNNITAPGSPFLVQGIPLCCPKCKIILGSKENYLHCISCNIQYPLQEGIPMFSPELDSFYEGKYTLTHRMYPNMILKYPFLKPLWRLYSCLDITQRPIRLFWKINLPPSATILDLGCGGGNELFTTKGIVIGMDVSFKSLQITKSVYPYVVQGTILSLPFPDSSMDCIVASHVIGHIPAPEKDILLKEIHRVLKIGGFMVLFAETDSTNSIDQFAKKYPGLYQKYFIDKPGHYGLELGTTLCSRIESFGFQPRQVSKLYGGLWAVQHYLVNFSQEYEQDSFSFRMFMRICRMINKFGPLNALSNCIVGVVAPIIVFFEPPKKIREWLLVYQK